eukprot:TRINITY_DN3745_c0_g4_i4.p1 TRINITY_DN3745_c0_g4~~TRINITY_DN3745_c0_g4_i4.p1  ORF type:complete len:379 (+),score=109.82 TRINITY_DN3745_c0_g4_i4:237-1373(+)
MELEEESARATGISFASFNQNQSCLCLGTVVGCNVYNLNQKLTKCASIDSIAGGLRVAKMLFSTSLMAVVPADKPRQVQLLDAQRVNSGPILLLHYVTPVLTLFLNMSRLVVVLENKIHLYDIKKMESIFTIDTNPNPHGICALSSTDDSLIAYPNSDEDGTVVLFDGKQLEVINMFPAHATRLRLLRFNNDGTLLASASEKGTVIHINEVGPGSKIRRRVGYTNTVASSATTAGDGLSERDTYAFRRGSFPAHITDVAFSPDSSLMCCASLSGTVHVFKLQRAHNAQSSLVSSYLPTMLAGMWEPQRSFAVAHGPSENTCIIGMSENNRELRVFAQDGKLRTYKINLEEGGEGEMVQETDLCLEPEVLENSVRARLL